MAANSKSSPCSKHRARQARYVARHPDAQRARARRHYRKNRDAVLAQKKAARKSGKRSHGGKQGRPRTGCKA